MTLRLLIACGAAETLGALAGGDGIVRFFFAPARGDETLPRAAEAGDIVLARIKTAAPALGGAFADIGAGEDAFLPARRDQPAPAEGTLLVLGVRRPALGGKGAVLDPDWTGALSPRTAQATATATGAPRLLSQPFDAALQIARRAAAFRIDRIMTDDPEAQRILAAEGFGAACDDIETMEIEDALADALGPHVELGGGGRLIIEETAGGAVVDVDAGPAANASRKPNDAVNERAARRLFTALSRRSIGGRIVVDFLPPSSPARRKALIGLLETGTDHYERRIGRLAVDGLADLTAPRRDRSLLERASEPAGEECLRPGRRVTIDWAAKRALAAVEARLARGPRLRVALHAGAAIADHIENRPQWAARIRDRHGARLTIVKSGSGRDYDVREI